MQIYTYSAHIIIQKDASGCNDREETITVRASHIREAAIIAMEEAEEMGGGWVVSIEQVG